MVKVGIIGAADIAYNRFIPALRRVDPSSRVAVASRDVSSERALRFQKDFGAELFPGYDELLAQQELDFVYVALPPAFHKQWTKRALAQGRHVLVEKPFATNLEDSEYLIQLARKHGLAVAENYMFVHHKQLDHIRRIIADGVIGALRVITARFSFPFRGTADFRYDKRLGGGALLDAGGYVSRLAIELLSEPEVDGAVLDISSEGLDTAGGFLAHNKDGLIYQGYFGMNDVYSCSVEVSGTSGSISTDRIFTAPFGFEPTITLRDANGTKTYVIEADDHFGNTITNFFRLMRDDSLRSSEEEKILMNARMMDDIRRMGVRG